MNDDDIFHDALHRALLMQLTAVFVQLQILAPTAEREEALRRIRPVRNRVAHGVQTGPADIRAALQEVSRLVDSTDSGSLGTTDARLLRLLTEPDVVAQVLARSDQQRPGSTSSRAGHDAPRDQGLGPGGSDQRHGAQLRRLRLAAGMSLGHLARELGYSKGYLSKLENGSARPSLTLMHQLERIFGPELTQSRSADTKVATERRSEDFGFGETAGVLPGDQRTFDDVEAGIVALWRQFGEHREQLLRDRLVLHYAPLVKYVAGRVGTGLPAHVEVADLIQSGIFGLVDAIEKFEPERGLKFETYAMQRIRGAILDDLRAQDWVPRSVRGRAREVERALERLGAKLRRTPTDAELAEELGLSLHELRDVYAQLQLTSVVALDELATLLGDQNNRQQLAQAIAHLNERDRFVAALYYFENLTLAEIGRILGITESRVCQLHTRVVLRLRAKLLKKTETHVTRSSATRSR